MISIRFEIPGFSSGTCRTSVPESVTAVLNFRRISSAESTMRTTPCGAPRDVAGQLEVLALIVADRDDVGLVEQDVAGHQHGVVEEPGGDELLLLRALLELGHPAQLAEARDRAEQPSRLGVRGDVALREDGRALRVEPGGEEERGDREGRLAEDVRLERRRDRVQVDDAEEGVALLLGRDVLAETAAVVAERLVAGRPDAGEDPHRPRHSSSFHTRTK